MNKKKILLFMLMMTMSFNINAAPSASFAETINNENIEVIATYDNEMPQDIKKIYKPKHTGEGVSYFDYYFHFVLKTLILIYSFLLFQY